MFGRNCIASESLLQALFMRSRQQQFAQRRWSRQQPKTCLGDPSAKRSSRILFFTCGHASNNLNRRTTTIIQCLFPLTGPPGTLPPEDNNASNQPNSHTSKHDPPVVLGPTIFGKMHPNSAPIENPPSSPVAIAMQPKDPAELRLLGFGLVMEVGDIARLDHVARLRTL